MQYEIGQYIVTTYTITADTKKTSCDDHVVAWYNGRNVEGPPWSTCCTATMVSTRIICNGHIRIILLSNLCSNVILCSQTVKYQFQFILITGKLENSYFAISFEDFIWVSELNFNHHQET